MDGQIETLRKNLQQQIQATVQAALALRQAEDPKFRIPHYDEIETHAHDLGCQLSVAVQEQRMRELVADAAPTAKCPGCGKSHQVETSKRVVTSTDGDVELLEQTAECPACRRAFFPSTDRFGI